MNRLFSLPMRIMPSPVTGEVSSSMVKPPISGDKEDKSNTALAEINNKYPYGGNNAADNSGVMTYVSICYLRCTLYTGH